MVEIETKKLSEIVLGMLAENVPEDQIMTNLQQSGIEPAQAKQIIAKAKKEFESYMGSKLEATVARIVEEKTTKKMEKLKREFVLQRDLKMMEQKEYTDRQIAAEKAQIGSLKSDVVASKITFDSGMKKIQNRIDSLKMSGSTQKLLAVGLLLAGIFAIAVIIFFGFDLMNYFMERKPLDIYIFMYLAVILLAAIGAIVALMVGYKIYSIGEREHKRVYVEPLRKKGPKKGSIQDMLRDQELA